MAWHDAQHNWSGMNGEFKICDECWYSGNTASLHEEYHSGKYDSLGFYGNKEHRKAVTLQNIASGAWLCPTLLNYDGKPLVKYRLTPLFHREKQ